MIAAVSIRDLKKTYNNGPNALDDINLEVKPGEIFALLGPNGAGKTTLISTICGITKATSGSIKIFDYDNVKDYRIARSSIGLVPQELTTDSFVTVWDSVSFSRSLFGKSPNPVYISEILERLSLLDKKDSQIRTLSGGMKKRVMIAKALSHEPSILFLDEPTSGVDVKLRKSMWEQVSELRKKGVTIILTTHYIEEAQEIADRIGIINKGKIILTEDKAALMKKLGKKELVISLEESLMKIPKSLCDFQIRLVENGEQIIFNYDQNRENNGVAELLDKLRECSIRYKDLATYQSSLEEIFIQLVGKS